MVKVNVPPALLKKAQQVAKLNALLNELDWRSEGYADQWEWLTLEYGEDRQMIKEGVV